MNPCDIQLYNRVICKVRKTQHQNPEFGHTQGEIQKKNLQKSTLAFQQGGGGVEAQKTINFGSRDFWVRSLELTLK